MDPSELKCKECGSTIYQVGLLGGRFCYEQGTDQEGYYGHDVEDIEWFKCLVCGNVEFICRTNQPMDEADREAEMGDRLYHAQKDERAIHEG